MGGWAVASPVLDVDGQARAVMGIIAPVARHAPRPRRPRSQPSAGPSQRRADAGRRRAADRRDRAAPRHRVGHRPVGRVLPRRARPPTALRSARTAHGVLRLPGFGSTSGPPESPEFRFAAAHLLPGRLGAREAEPKLVRRGVEFTSEPHVVHRQATRSSGSASSRNGRHDPRGYVRGASAGLLAARACQVLTHPVSSPNVRGERRSDAESGRALGAAVIVALAIGDTSALAKGTDRRRLRSRRRPSSQRLTRRSLAPSLRSPGHASGSSPWRRASL